MHRSLFALASIVVLGTAAGAFEITSPESDARVVQQVRPARDLLPPGAVIAAQPRVRARPTAAPTPTPFPDVPAVSVPSAGISCPDGWQFFDNPVVHYSICYPSGWGFTGFEGTRDPLAIIPGDRLGWVNLLSANAFPYVSFPSDATIATIGTLAPGTGIDGCQPDIPIIVSGIHGKWCEQTYDIVPGPQAIYSDEGSRHTLVLLVPLAQPPETPPYEIYWESRGFKLYATITTPTQRYADRSEQLFRMIDTIRIY